MVIVKNFSESLNSSMDRLNAHIETERERPSAERMTQKEIVKNSVEKYAAEVAPLQNVAVAHSGQGPVSQATPSYGGSAVLPNYLLNSEIAETVRTEVSHLIELVYDKGLDDAIKESKKHSPFVIDAFHDALVDKLMPELEKRGIVK